MDLVVWRGARYQLIGTYTESGQAKALIRQLKPEESVWGTPNYWDVVAPLRELETPCQPSLS